MTKETNSKGTNEDFLGKGERGLSRQDPIVREMLKTDCHSPAPDRVEGKAWKKGLSRKYLERGLWKDVRQWEGLNNLEAPSLWEGAR